jgi:hypothetical protein
MNVEENLHSVSNITTPANESQLPKYAKFCMEVDFKFKHFVENGV